MGSQTPERPPEGAGDAHLNLFLFLSRLGIRGAACSVWVFMRRDLGCEALSGQGLAAVPVLVIYAGLGHCPEALTIYLPLYLLVVVGHRIRSRAIRWRVHSGYEGTPWLAKRLCFFLRPGEDVAKRVIEPVIALGVGWLLVLAGAEAMGAYVMGSGVCLLGLEAHFWATREARARAWIDREWEARAFAEHLRHRRR